MTALERARFVSQALSDAARRARFSSKARRNLSGGGFAARKGAVAFRWMTIISFWLIVAIPGALAVAYFGFVASDQYRVDVQFTVAGGEPVLVDGLTAITGIPSITIIQDIQIVTNFLQSRAAVEKIQAKIDLRAKYSTEEADWLARFNPTKPIEKFVRYWQKMTEVSIKLPGGIVDFKVRAFTPQDAKDIAEAALRVAEELINDINQRQNTDAMRNAEIEVERASKRLMDARLALEEARNSAGILDVTSTITSLNTLINELRSGMLKMQQEYQAQLRVVSETAPQMRNLRSRIEAMNTQIAELEARLTSTRRNATPDGTLALSMTRFAVLDMERQIAERIYAGSVSTLEVARITAERKRMYLNTFVLPSLPQEAQYPRRILFSLAVIVGLLVVWGVIIGLAGVVRNHMA
ncbi:MAG: lipopolysaccharide biosynthesis protein [Methylobacterium sp.]|nr:MAG: lipopolysaccharide biosynthesis protein [Methylobacterium sp.]